MANSVHHFKFGLDLGNPVTVPGGLFEFQGFGGPAHRFFQFLEFVFKFCQTLERTCLFGNFQVFLEFHRRKGRRNFPDDCFGNDALFRSISRSHLHRGGAPCS